MVRASRSALAVAGVLAVVGTAAVLTAGPLNPPPGPVASTYKTLSEVEPRIPISSLPATLTTRGSYYLTGNLTQQAGLDGILVFVGASGSVIDLNGFTISGGRTGVAVDAATTGVTIRNGTVRDTSGSGVFALVGAGGSSDGMRVENVRVLNVADIGIRAGRGATVEGCYVRGANVGIDVGFSSLVSRSTVEFARQTGFQVAGGSALEQCVAAGTAGGPTNGNGFNIGRGSTATAITSRSNTGVGARIDPESTVTGSTFTNNTLGGVDLAASGRLSDSVISGNGNIGVFLNASNQFGVGAVVERCTISTNDRYGIANFDLGNHTIRDNVINRNGDFGVLVRDNCQVVGNRIGENGTTASEGGLLVRGNGNLVRGNDFLGNFGFSWQL